jgi:hypothetical protein
LPQKLSKTPSLVVPTTDSELLKYRKVFRGVGLRWKARETSSSPMIVSMVSKVARTIQTLQEKIFTVFKDRDEVPWSPKALDGVHSS